MDGNLQHEIISDIKRVAAELGRVPTRDEYHNQGKLGRWRVQRAFGTFAAALEAAGFENKRQIIDSTIFEVPIQKHLDQYIPREHKPRGPLPAIAVISDIHWPFECKRVVDRFLEFVGDTKPEFVVINGDAWDMYAHSKFPRSHNIFTPRDERIACLQKNDLFWREIRLRSPNSKCHQQMGNHDLRPMKRVLEAYPAAEDWIAEALKRDFTFDGVATCLDDREELIIEEDIAIFHGYRSQLGAHRDFTLMNTINGHSHVGGVVFRQIRGRTLWELNSGLAGDPEAKGLTYTPQRITNWTPGFGQVDKLGPRFIPA